MKNIIKFEDFNILQEFYFLWKMEHFKKSNKSNRKTRNRILIVDTGLIGDTLATLKPLSLFLKKRNEPCDIIVSYPLKTLIEHMRGIDKVFTAKSVYGRANEFEEKQTQVLGSYSEVIVLRISKESFNIIKNLQYDSMKTYYSAFIKYSFHLIESIFLRRKPKQWIDFNFEVLGIQKPHNEITFHDIFNFENKDYRFIDKFDHFSNSPKKVLIHTGSGWNSKLWETKKWIDLVSNIKKLGSFQIIFVGYTSQEENTFKTINVQLGFEVTSLINKVDLKELALLMEYSDYFIGVDSGPRNLAHIVGLRSITLLNPAAPNNFMPPAKEDIAIDNPTFFKLGLFSLNTRKIDGISVEEVSNDFKRLANIF